MRDITLEDTIIEGFSTRAFGTGVPTTLAGTPVLSVLEGGNATPITSGVSVSVDRASVAGTHEFTVVATAANGYENGKSYSVYISTGTVGGTSVVGEIVGKFTIGASAAAVDLANGTDGLGAIKGDTSPTLVDTNELQQTLSAGIAAKTNDANLNDSLHTIIDLVESQRPHHTHTSPGRVFHVDPVNGDTHANGNRGGIADPYLTIQDCHDNAVTDSAQDLILLIPGAAAGATTHTVAATTTISKRYTLIRGPGRDFIITRTGSGDTLALTGEGVEIEGIQIGTAATGSGNGISVTADFAYIHNNWINDTRGDGINLNQSGNCIIENNRFQNTGLSGSGDGVEINGTGSSSSNNVIRNNIFEDVAGDAVKVSGGTILDTIITGNLIHGSTGFGISISADSTDAFVCNNCMGNNSSGDISDSGTTTILRNNEQWGTAVNLATVDTVVDAILVDTAEIGTAGVGLTAVSLAATGLDAIVSTATGMVEIAKAVWDRIISKANHDIGQSGGKILRQSGDLVQIDGEVSDVSPATTGFDTNLTQADGFFEDAVMIFANGSANAGIGLPVSSYLNASGAVTFDAPDDWPVTPVNGDDFVIFATHVHPVSQIADAVLDEDLSGHTTTGTLGKATSDIETDTGTSIPADIAALNDISAAEVNAEVDTALADYDGPTNAEFEVRTPTAAELAYITANAATAVPVTFTTSGGSTTAAVLNQVDGAAASSTDDQYNGRLLVFTSGTLGKVVTDITDYDGTTKVATITAIPFAPTATHAGRLV